MPKAVLMLCLFLCIQVPAHAQMIRGKVVDDLTSAPVAGVAVELIDSAGRALSAVRTDTAGSFVLLSRTAGMLIVRARHPSFVTADSLRLLVRPGEAVAVELRMSSRALPLEPLLVTARVDVGMVGYWERLRDRAKGFGRFVTRAEIDQRPGARASDLLRELPGVYLQPLMPFGNRILLRGTGGSCSPTIYVDGMVLSQTVGAVDEFLTASMLEGVEIYTGVRAPSPINALGTCGVVAFWTRMAAGERPPRSKRGLALLAVGAGVALTVLLAR